MSKNKQKRSQRPSGESASIEAGAEVRGSEYPELDPDSRFPTIETSTQVVEPTNANPETGSPAADFGAEVIASEVISTDHAAFNQACDEVVGTLEPGILAADQVLPSQGSANPLEPSNSLDLSKLSPESQELVRGLMGEIANIKGTSKPKVGSKPRANTVYVLVANPPKFSTTPQVRVIQEILFGNKLGIGGSFKKELTETEAFGLVEAAKSSGKLRTVQPAVRILQYYKSKLISEDQIRVI